MQNPFSFFRNHSISSLTVVAIAGGGIAYYAMIVQPRATELVSPKRGPIVEAVYGIGTVTSNKQFHGRIAQATGIRSIPVKEGDVVEKGTRLVILQEGAGFVAPFKGTVTSLPFFVGETVLNGTIVVTLQDMKDLYILATLEQQGALRVHPGQNVRLNFESLRSQTFNGKVKSVYPQDSQFLVRIAAEGFPPNILPSMTADVAIEIDKRENVLLVPFRAISGGKVIVSRAGKQEKIDVTIGTTDGEWAEIAGGNLSESDKVLLPK